MCPSLAFGEIISFCVTVKNTVRHNSYGVSTFISLGSSLDSHFAIWRFVSGSCDRNKRGDLLLHVLPTTTNFLGSLLIIFLCNWCGNSIKMGIKYYKKTCVNFICFSQFNPSVWNTFKSDVILGKS